MSKEQNKERKLAGRKQGRDEGVKKARINKEGSKDTEEVRKEKKMVKMSYLRSKSSQRPRLPLHAA